MDPNNRLVQIFSVAVLAGFGSYLAFHSAKPIRLRERGTTAPAERDLVRELERLRATPLPRARQRLLDRAPELAARFDAPMDRLLRLAESPLLEQAAEYVGAMGVVDLRAPLKDLVLSPRSLTPRTRILGLRSIETLRPWRLEELRHLVVYGSDPMRVGAIELCARREDAPWPEIVGLLREPEENETPPSPEVLDAVLHALPRNLDTRLREELWQQVMIAEGERAALLLRALRRTAPSADLVSRLLAHFDQLDGSGKVAALDLLGAWQLPLSGELLQDAVLSEHITTELRARALYCLERTNSFDAGSLVDALPRLPEQVQFFAARCLLKKGESAGYTALLDLLEGAAAPDARVFLGWLTSMSPGSTPDAFAEARERALQLAPQREFPAAVFD